MTARVQVPDAVAETLQGERLADQVIRKVRDGFGHPDELSFYLIEMLETDGQAGRRSAMVRGFCRRLQKSLEGAR